VKNKSSFCSVLADSERFYTAAGEGTHGQITISGAGLKNTIEISDAQILANFSVWAGPEHTYLRPTRDFIIDWSQGPVRETPSTLRKYQVAFYAGSPQMSKIVYVVYYAFNRGSAPVMCICPVNPVICSSEMCVQFSAELKVTGFARGRLEGVARPLIEKAASSDSIQPR